MSADRRELIGLVSVDSGTIVIVDPGYLRSLADGEPFTSPEQFYDEQIMGAGFDRVSMPPFEVPRLHWPINFHCAGDPLAVAFRSGFGDGDYEVYATIGPTPWGDRVKRVEIVLIDTIPGEKAQRTGGNP